MGRTDKKLFSFAGLYEHWTDVNSGELLQSCTIITYDAYPAIKHIHPRMPVILPSEHYQLWLNATTDDFPVIEEQEIDFYPIEKEVGAKQSNYELMF
ncbi:MAG: SOS response-associated peptidase family protein [Cocleimonas sp.]